MRCSRTGNGDARMCDRLLIPHRYFCSEIDLSGMRARVIVRWRNHVKTGFLISFKNESDNMQFIEFKMISSDNYKL